MTGAWDSWIGREEVRTDRVDPEMVHRWCSALDRTLPDDGTAPQGLHWCLGLPDVPTAGLGPDGHPLRSEGVDSFLPPVPLSRRMWAGSQVQFLAPLRTGEAVRRLSRIASVKEKKGGSGLLVFVEVAHETRGEGGLAVRETQTIVYREPAGAAAPLSPPPTGDGAFDPSGWDAHRAILPDERLLFRYSALTFNSHRIHYDLPYAREVERYRGLVVHGPLTATMLLDLARRNLGEQALATFAFRGESPAICGETLHLALRRVETGYQLGAFAADGRQVMSVTAIVRT